MWDLLSSESEENGRKEERRNLAEGLLKSEEEDKVDKEYEES